MKNFSIYPNKISDIPRLTSVRFIEFINKTVEGSSFARFSHFLALEIAIAKHWAARAITNTISFVIYSKTSISILVKFFWFLFKLYFEKIRCYLSKVLLNDMIDNDARGRTMTWDRCRTNNVVLFVNYL